MSLLIFFPRLRWTAVSAVRWPLRFMTAVALAICAAGCADASDRDRDSRRAVGGILDLRDWRAETDGPVALSGEWGFYWQEFRAPRCAVEHAEVFDLPGVWNGTQLGEETLSGQGYATFCLRVEFGQAPQAGLAMRLPRVRTAGAVWVNGVLVGRTGRVGTDVDSSVPVRIDQLVAIAPAETLDIVLQVSNYHFRTGGPDKPMVLAGSVHQLEPLSNSVESAAAAFFTGGFLILGLYHLLLRASKERARASRIFGMLCLVMAGYQLTRANNLFVLLFGLTWQTEIRLEYSLFALCVPLGASFLRTLFPIEVPFRLVLASSIVCAVFVASVLILPTSVSSRWSLAAFQLVFLGLGVWGLVAIGAAVRRRRPGAAWILMAAALWIFTGLGDGIVARLDPDAPRFLPFGFMGVIIAQAVVLSIAQAQQNRETKELSTNLLKLASERLSLERAAYRDPLTGLENRRRLDESGAQLRKRLGGEETAGSDLDRVALLYIDVDRFKSINDRFGHDVGDEVLVRVADAIRVQVRPSDLSVRLGGDEFVILASGTDARGAEELASRLRRELARPMEVAGHPIRVSLSIGIASSAVDAFDLGTLMQQADRAMYREKTAGRGAGASSA